MAWAAKPREKISQPTQPNSTIVLHFFAFQTIIPRLHKRFVEMNMSGKEISDVIVRKMYACNDGFVLPALKKVGTDFSKETATSGSDDDSFYSVIVIQILVSSFVHVHVALFLPHQFSMNILIVAILMSLQKQGKGTTRVGKAQDRIRSQSLIQDLKQRIY